MITSDSYPIWQCLGHHPTRWGLERGNKIVAMVTQQLRTGDWTYSVFNAPYERTGRKPSQEVAMRTVTRILADFDPEHW